MNGAVQGLGHEIIHHGHTQTSAPLTPSRGKKGVEHMRHMFWRDTTGPVAYGEEKVRPLVIGMGVKRHRNLASGAIWISVAFHIGQEIEQDPRQMATIAHPG